MQHTAWVGAPGWGPCCLFTPSHNHLPCCTKASWSAEILTLQFNFLGMTGMYFELKIQEQFRNSTSCFASRLSQKYYSMPFYLFFFLKENSSSVSVLLTLHSEHSRYLLRASLWSFKKNVALKRWDPPASLGQPRLNHLRCPTNGSGRLGWFNNPQVITSKFCLFICRIIKTEGWSD